MDESDLSDIRFPDVIEQLHSYSKIFQVIEHFKHLGTSRDITRYSKTAPWSPEPCQGAAVTAPRSNHAEAGSPAGPRLGKPLGMEVRACYS